MSFEKEPAWSEKARFDPQEFSKLYNYYFPKLYTYVSYRVGNLQDTEDIVSETFLRAIRQLEHFEGQHQSSFAAWLFRIAYNLIQDGYRQRHKQNNPLNLDELNEVPADSASPDEIIVQKEEFAHLYRLIKTLSARRQEVITLKFFGGLRNQEIAQILGLDERTVASNLCRALESLQHKYSADFSKFGY
jgi:RNA polymerase sigma-70 factor (ECF subfamily)